MTKRRRGCVAGPEREAHGAARRPSTYPCVREGRRGHASVPRPGLSRFGLPASLLRSVAAASRSHAPPLRPVFPALSRSGLSRSRVQLLRSRFCAYATLFTLYVLRFALFACVVRTNKNFKR